MNTWSPHGRLHQVEYALEAVKQGSACVGLRSNTTVVLAALKRSPGDLASHQRKVHEIDDHLAIAVSGLTADGRILSQYLRNECINHRFVYDTPVPIGRLVKQLADKHQKNTVQSWSRPYGVGLLVAGVDEAGPHLYQTQPDATYYEWQATAIGARSQAAKTYLERNFETFPGLGEDELVRHGLKALRGTLAEGGLTTENCSLAIATRDKPLRVLEGEALRPWLDLLAASEAGEEGGGGGGGGGGDGDGDGDGANAPTAEAGAMETD